MLQIIKTLSYPMANVVDFQAVDNLKSDGFVLVYNIITIFTFQIY